MFRFFLKEDWEIYWHQQQKFLTSKTSDFFTLRMLSAQGSEHTINAVFSHSPNAPESHTLCITLQPVEKVSLPLIDFKNQELNLENQSENLLNAQKYSRELFSRNLHDRISPNIAALILNLGILKRDLAPSPSNETYINRIDDTRALVEDTANSIREICANLDSPLDAKELQNLIQKYVLTFQIRTGLKINFHCINDGPLLEPTVALLLFRIIQEALTNTAKHAQAKNLKIELTLFKSKPKFLSIVDDGVGFDSTQIPSSLGRGLLNMKENTELMLGRFRLESTMGLGTRICIEF
jgi:two-component system CheB/CheR fusion protein